MKWFQLISQQWSIQKKKKTVSYYFSWIQIQSENCVFKKSQWILKKEKKLEIFVFTKIFLFIFVFMHNMNLEKMCWMHQRIFPEKYSIIVKYN